MATYDITTNTPLKIETGDILNCPSTKAQQSITLPKGTYKLECWGAAGNRPYSKYAGYSAGTITLPSKTTLYIYVGGKPTSRVGNYFEGGWNGGGSSYGNGSDSGSGGGATDICLVPSEMTIDTYGRYLRTEESYKSRLIVAGGSGGGYSSGAEFYNYRSGGWCPAQATTGTNYQGGMTSAGGMSNPSNMIAGGFGYGVTSTQTGDDYSGGGGGWYGGGSAGDSYSGGGSSFVWCDAYASYVPTGYSLSDNLRMSDVKVLYGNQSIIDPISGSVVTGRSEDGYARITAIDVRAGSECFINVNGTWKISDSIYANSNGEWKRVEEIKSNINGAWK